MSRPELIAPPELFYDDKEASKYTGNSRIIAIQTAMAERCLELLNFPDDSPKLILDIGCGSGLSGDVLTEAGHSWVGLDISPSMLDIAVQREVEGDTLLADMGQGFGFRAGMFDGVISVSALQWLCYSDKKDHKSTKRLNNFFTALYRCLRRGARAALQIYPETAEQLDLISQTAAACGFGGGLVVDFPNSTKAKKYFLCLYAGIDPAAKGTAGAPALPKALGVKASAFSSSMSVASGATGAVNDDDDVVRAYSRSKERSKALRAANSGSSAQNVPADDEAFEGAAQQAVFEKRRARAKKARRAGSGKAGGVKSKAWIAAKKASRSAKGLATKRDSKYSGRKRGPKF